jgi:hypothetical protein
LLTEIAALPIQWGGYWLLGQGKTYGWVYGVTSGLIYLAVLWNVADAIRNREYRLRPLAIAAILSLSFARLAYGQIETPTWHDWLHLADGLSLLWAGVILAYSAPYNKPSMVSLVLGWYWMAEGLYDFLLVSYWPLWFPSSEYIPQLMEVVFFGIIFCLLSRSAKTNRGLAALPRQ